MVPRTLSLVLLAGCGPSPVAVCAGTHWGAFDGVDMGSLDATLDERGRADITLTAQLAGTLESSGKVERDGTIALDGVVDIDGLLDLETCDSEGTWSTGLFGGTWWMRLE